MSTTTPDYHERVAARMKQTWAGPTLPPYEAVLAKLRHDYPTEADLREVINAIEVEAINSGQAPVNYDFLRDG